MTINHVVLRRVSLILNFKLLMVCVNNLKTINRKPSVWNLEKLKLKEEEEEVDPPDVKQLTPN